MNAMKNVVHMVAMGIWVVLAGLFTLNAAVGGNHASLGDVLSLWVWMIGYGAALTWGVSCFKHPLAAAALHGSAWFGMQLLPKVFPISLFRLGFDLLFSR